MENNKVEQFQNAAALSLELAEGQLKNLFLLLQNGFYLEAEVGCTIENFFREQLLLSQDYIAKRIQGIFLNGKPADDIDTAVVRDGARLTLSGTMPGLAGMSLRRGPLAVFRHGITHRESGDCSYSGAGFIQLKILNLLMKDIGPGLLRKGIYFHAAVLSRFLEDLPEGFWQECRKISLDGRDISPGSLRVWNIQFTTGMVKFSVRST